MHWIDHTSLPATRGKLSRFLINTHGDIDGMVLTSSSGASILIHTPPHMHDDVERELKIGDDVVIYGVRPRHADVIAAVAFSTSDGRTLIDEGPDAHKHDKHEAKHEKDHKPKPRSHHGHEKKQDMEAEGEVDLALFAPKGELRGALLTDGTIVRVGPKEAEHLAALLSPGAAVSVRGHGLETVHGKVIDAEEIGTDPASLKPVKNQDHGPLSTIAKTVGKLTGTARR